MFVFCLMLCGAYVVAALKTGAPAIGRGVQRSASGRYSLFAFVDSEMSKKPDREACRDLALFHGNACPGSGNPP